MQQQPRINVSSMTKNRSQKVLIGTCGWSDQSLVHCGRFYPPSVRTSTEKLTHYSRHFPCVEVDSSCYAIPQPESVRGWTRCVPEGFIFHFKAFGLFPARSVSTNALPREVRHMLGRQSGINMDGAVRTDLKDLSPDAIDALWRAQNAALLPAYQSGKLGFVMFQFHLSFGPSEENRQHVMWCRERLDHRYAMAVEFRNRAWGGDGPILAWMRKSGIVLVAADELLHETVIRRDRGEEDAQLHGGSVSVMPILWELTDPKAGAYVRVHRRVGRERLLSPQDQQAWAHRLLSLTRAVEDGEYLSVLRGPVYFLWGTDWEDQPMRNAKALEDALTDVQQKQQELKHIDLVYDWKSEWKRECAAARGSLASFLSFANEQKKTPTLYQNQTILSGKNQTTGSSALPCSFTSKQNKTSSEVKDTEAALFVSNNSDGSLKEAFVNHTGLKRSLPTKKSPPTKIFTGSNKRGKKKAGFSNSQCGKISSFFLKKQSTEKKT